MEIDAPNLNDALQEASTEEKLTSLKDSISQNPYNYQSHLDYVQLLRGHHDKQNELEAARRNFQQHFPLSEYIWMDWLNDKLQSCNGVEDYIDTDKLFSLAVKDYLSTTIWSSYMQFKIETNALALEENNTDLLQVFSTKQVCDVVKLAEQTTRFHFTESHVIWDIYITFMRERGFSALYPSVSIDELSLQCYLKRLEIPHEKIESTFATFSTFVTQSFPNDYESIMINANRVFSNTLKKSNAISRQELLLRSSGYPLEEFESFVNSEMRKPKQIAGYVVTLLERLLSIYPLSTDGWCLYVSWIIKETREDESANINLLNVCERAIRNCPWTAKFWIFLWYAMLLYSTDVSEIEKSKELAFSTGLITDHGEIVELLCGWLQISVYICAEKENSEDYIRSQINYAKKFIATTLSKGKHDFFKLDLSIIALHTAVSNVDAALKLWSHMEKVYPHKSQFWIQRFEWLYPRDKKLALDTLTRGLSKKLDNPKELMEYYDLVLVKNYDLFSALEQEYDLFHAKRLFQQRLLREAVSGTKEHSLESTVQIATPETTQLRPKLKRNIVDEESAMPKKIRFAAKQRNREELTILVTNIPTSASPDDIRSLFSDCGTINELVVLPDDDGQTKVAQVEFAEPGEVLAAKTKHLKKIHGHEINVRDHADTTLFVTNFPPSFDEQAITALFEPFGAVVQVRFPSLKFNARRRFCYVQMRTPEEAHNTLQLNGKLLEGNFELKVHLSDPDNKQSREGPIYEKRELYVTNIDFACTKTDVEKFFSRYGSVENVRLPSRNPYRHAGFGYVVMSNKDEAERALSATGERLGSRVLNVVISVAKPPKKVINSSKPPVSTKPSGTELPRVTLEQVHNKSLGVMNVDETVNEARLRQMFEPYGELFRVVLHPEHNGAIVEYKDPAKAGKAAMSVEGYELAGRRLHIGSVDEMMHAKLTDTSENPSTKSSALEFVPNIRTLRRGHRLGNFKAAVQESTNDDMDTDAPKSNDDFRRMFLNN
ncbi:RNA-binding protein Prp24 [Schizosaccharomyces japonicus yFS275]|uniref:U4/U6 snRNA-associated-splicing factor PRP24 n=1 Tax=Schizosaccharomyces japonicus (strain yFS275 / FY16936) TaxID=402676 RepID=B6K3M4_SCHJY|nr:RNA-binding protein Prp24 [Schizosaccharomyces japonicus yFS275]EEB08081.1 RNA-binding protein Prp24 [Schizosaccharomyces japonicus yFS275]